MENNEDRRNREKKKKKNKLIIFQFRTKTSDLHKFCFQTLGMNSLLLHEKIHQLLTFVGISL